MHTQQDMYTGYTKVLCDNGHLTIAPQKFELTCSRSYTAITL